MGLRPPSRESKPTEAAKAAATVYAVAAAFCLTETPGYAGGNSLKRNNDKKTPFDLEYACGLATANEKIKRRSFGWGMTRTV